MHHRIALVAVVAWVGCSVAAPDTRGARDASPPPDASPHVVRSDAGPANPAPPDGAAAPAPDATGCAAMVHDTAQVEGSAADTYRWSDADCRPRAASLLRNDAADAFGGAGGYLRSLRYDVGSATRACRGTGTNGWQGFGYVVDHYGSGAAHTQHVLGTTTVLLAGEHLVVHQFEWHLDPGGPVDVTAEWRMATGQDHPIFAITFDSSHAGPNVVDADTRAPYGDMAYEGATPGPVSGVGWGDSYAFTTTSAPVTPASSWDYSQPNEIPYDVTWSTPADAEMGLVGTGDFATGPSGGDYGGGVLAAQWGKIGNDLLTDLPDWSWPYQLDQYELPFGTTSHRLAWGASYGAVGRPSYTSFGRTLSGYPYTSYAVYVVFGTHTNSAVSAEVGEMKATLGATLDAARGTVSTSGPAPGRTDAVPFAHAGWDALRGAWSVDAAGDAATVTLDAGSATLRHPMFVVRGWTAGAPHVAWNGAALTPDEHYFATVDPARGELWITLAFAVKTGTLDVSP